MTIPAEGDADGSPILSFLIRDPNDTSELVMISRSKLEHLLAVKKIATHLVNANEAATEEFKKLIAVCRST